jgi:hypothetical protein
MNAIATWYATRYLTIITKKPKHLATLISTDSQETLGVWSGKISQRLSPITNEKVKMPRMHIPTLSKKTDDCSTIRTCS